VSGTAATQVVSGTAAATGKQSQGQWCRGQRPAALSMMEDGDQA
jgi:hypothetical protein